VWHVLAAPGTPGHARATTKVANDFPVGNLQVRPKRLCRLCLCGGKPKNAKLRASQRIAYGAKISMPLRLALSGTVLSGMAARRP
jgi:hypothetical protein